MIQYDKSSYDSISELEAICYCVIENDKNNIKKYCHKYFIYIDNT